MQKKVSDFQPPDLIILGRPYHCDTCFSERSCKNAWKPLLSFNKDVSGFICGCLSWSPSKVKNVPSYDQLAIAISNVKKMYVRPQLAILFVNSYIC